MGSFDYRFYDSLSRLLTADYDNGTTVYTYGYDVAGNLVNNNGVTRTYNAANQMVNDGTNTLSYDNNGNLTGDGVNAYTWDRANRLLTAPGSTSYKYDGLSNRIQQTVSSVVTDYLNDVQPGLVKLLRQDNGLNVEHFVHAPRGIHAMHDGTHWNWYMQDGLGSVRGLVDDAAVVQNSMSYDSYGDPMESYGAGYLYAGEQVGSNGLSYNRNRYYSPEFSTWLSLDPLETPNRYAYVSGNPVNLTDPDGLCAQPTQWGNPVDANCYYSAVGLAQRFSQGDPDTYQRWFDTFIQKEWHELKAIEALGTAASVGGASRQLLDNAAIIPRLFRENPMQALEALRQYTCENSGSLIGGVAHLINTSASLVIAPRIGTLGSGAGNAVGGLGRLGLLGLAVAGGIGAATGVITLWDEFTQSYEQEDDDAIPIPWPTPPTREGQKIVLFRAVAEAEFAFIRSSGYRSYGFSPHGGGKYFALTKAGVTAFLNASINIGEHSIVAITKVRVSPEIIAIGSFFHDTGQYGAGWSIHFSDEALVVMYATILTSNERIVRIG